MRTPSNNRAGENMSPSVEVEIMLSVVAWLSLGAKMHTASAITLDMLAMLKRLFRTYTRIYIYVYIYIERDSDKERESGLTMRRPGYGGIGRREQFAQTHGFVKQAHEHDNDNDLVNRARGYRGWNNACMWWRG